MAIRPIELGAVGRRVAQNITDLRHSRHLGQTELAGIIRRLGRPMTAPVVSKTEKGDRRVDAADLVLFAAALDTTPNRLLLPGDAGTEPVELAPKMRVPALSAWRWATGDSPLPGGAFPPDRQMLVSDDRERMFTGESRPHEQREPEFRNVGHVMQDHPELVQATAALVHDAIGRGIGARELNALVAYVFAMSRIDLRRGVESRFAAGAGER